MYNDDLKRLRAINREKQLSFGRRMETRHILSLKDKVEDARRQRKSRSWQKDWR